MFKTLASEHSNGLKILKNNWVHLFPTRYNIPKYYQAVLSNCHRLAFTTCHSIKKNPAIGSSYFDRYMGARIGSIIRRNHVPASVPNKPNVLIKKCYTHDEFDECVALQQLVWNTSNLQLIPRRSFINATNTGGIVLGAYQCVNNSPVLVGFILAFAGIRPYVNGGIYWYAEMFGVDPRVRGQGVARQLLLGLRNHALAKDIKLIKYNFDPTEVRNACMYIEKTGSIGRKYSSNHYGMFSSSGKPKPFSGRLIMECWLESLHTRRCLELETSSERSIYKPKIIAEVLVPAEMGKWKQTRDIRAIDAYKRIDEQFTVAFARELSVLGFRTESDGNSFFELGYFSMNEI